MELTKLMELNNKKFPSLYTNDKKGGIREWNINVIEIKENNLNYSNIIVSHGLLNGKHITNISKIEKGKNIGKINETSHYQQALAEATSKWNKKKDIEKYTITIPENIIESTSNNTNYTINTNDTNSISNTVNIPTQSIRPMLAYDYKKYKNKVIFPCFIQKKYDGYRLLYNNITYDMYSRNGKKYDILYNTELHNMLKKINLPLDGEIYSHDQINVNFESYGVLRKKKITDSDLQLLDKLEYHVYDIVIPNKPYNERFDILKKAITSEFSSKIKLVDSFQCNSESDINNYHQSFVNNNYEGSIIRNKLGLYSSKRSFDLLKYKDFDDDEFVITDFTSEKDTSNESVDLIIWICSLNDNKSITFNIRPQGTKQEREMLYKMGKTFIGQKLWVKFFGYTENKIPRFPGTKTNTYKTYIRNIQY